jgi:hypothetical protein
LLRLWEGDVDETRVDDFIHALALVDYGDQYEQPRFEKKQIEEDATPDLTQSGVWFDARNNARLSFNPQAEISEKNWNGQQEIEAAFALPRAYALLKFCCLAGRLPAVPYEGKSHSRNGGEPRPCSPLRLLNLLLAGRSSEALQTAARSLRAKGYSPIVPDTTLTSDEWTLSTEDSQRLAGLLLIPVRSSGILAALSLKPQPN